MSIIDRELTVEGTVSFKGQLIVKGAGKGNLHGDTVVIAEEGSVEARATVANITIGGTFSGELESSEKLTILATGKCSGKVQGNSSGKKSTRKWNYGNRTAA